MTLKPSVFTFFLLAFTLLNACSHSPSLDTASLKSADSAVRDSLVFVALSDLRGTVESVPLLQRNLDILRKNWGNRLVVLNSGHSFFGSLESQLSEGQTSLEMLEALRPDLSLIAPEEVEIAKKSSLAGTFLSGRPVRSFIQEISGIKIGYVGWDITQNNKSSGSESDVLKEITSLRSQKVDVIVGLVNGSLSCMALQSKQDPAFFPVWKKEFPMGTCKHNSNIVISLRALKQLAKGRLKNNSKPLFDFIVSSGSQELVHHWVEGIPIVQSGGDGKFFHLVHVPLNSSNLPTAPIEIEGPIPVYSSANPTTPLVSKLYGESLAPQSASVKWLQSWQDRLSARKQATPAHLSRTIPHTALAESPLSNLVADAIREATQADFALVNPSFLRTGLAAGPISLSQMYQSLPFDNRVAIVEVTGKELKEILGVVFCGAKGFYGTSGLKISLIDFSLGAPSNDLDHDRKISYWEVNRVVDIRTLAGEKINSHKRYRLATVDTLANGGDDWQWSMEKISNQRKTISETQPTIRSVVIDYLKKSDREISSEASFSDSRILLKRISKWSS